MLVFPVYARIFSVEEFGLLALMVSGVALCSIAANLGLNSAMQRFYLDQGATPESRRSVASTGLVMLVCACTVVTVATLAVVLAARAAGLLPTGSGLVLALAALATVGPNQVVQYLQDVLRVRFMLLGFAVIAAMKSLVGILLGLALVLGGAFRVEGLFIGQLIACAIAIPVAVWLVRTDLGAPWSDGDARRSLSYGWPLALSGLAYWVVSSMDVWLLATLASATEAGLYGAASRIAVLMAFATSAFGMAWAPYALKTFAEDPDYRRTLSRHFVVWMHLIALLGLLLVLFAFEVLWLLTPEAYWAAAPALAGLAAGAVLHGSTQVTVLGLSLARRTRTIGACAWIAALVHLVASLLLVPVLGATGSGMASVISFTALSGLYVVFSQRAHPLHLDWLRLLLPVGFVWTAYVATLLIGQQAAPSMALVLAKLALVGAFLVVARAAGVLSVSPLVAAMKGWRG